MQQTLMLDYAKQPVDLKSWEECMVDWANDKVCILETYADRVIHRGRDLYMPCVAQFVFQPDARRRSIRFSRDNVYIRDKGRCQYCACKVPRPDVTYDHVVPRRLGGQTVWKNVVICCFACNQRKAGRTPEQAGMFFYTGDPPAKPKYLPPKPDRRFIWRPGMPSAWRPYLRTRDELASYAYWYSELLPG